MTAFFRSAKCLWLVIPAYTAVAFLAGKTLTGCNSSKEPTTTAKQMEEVQAALKRMEGELISLRQGIPRETEQNLKDLENSLSDPKHWPQDAEAAERMRQRLDEIVQALSPGAAERIMPQIVRLNWGIEALWNLRNHANAAPNQLDEAQSTIREFLERHPRKHFQEIQKVLETRLKEIDPQVRAFQVKELLERASLALEGKEDASAAFSSLEEYREKKEVAAIMPKLRAKVLEKNGLERIESFEKNLNRTRSFGDDRARQVSLLTIQEGVLRLTIDLQLEESAPKEVLKKGNYLLAQCDKELLALAAKQQDDNAKKLRRYQSWALEQIRKFDSKEDGWYYDFTYAWLPTWFDRLDRGEAEYWGLIWEFPSIKDFLELPNDDKNLSVEQQKQIAAKRSSKLFNELAYIATRDGMVKFLLPIQTHLLDPPVARLYDSAFSKGWQKLEGNASWVWHNDERGWARKADQLFVAEQSATVQKKTLDEIASSNR